MKLAEPSSAKAGTMDSFEIRLKIDVKLKFEANV